MEKEFYITMKDFKSAIAKEFDVNSENVIIDIDGTNTIYGFDIKHEILTEMITIAHDEVNRALGLNKSDRIEYMEYSNGEHSSVSEPHLIVHVTVVHKKPIYKEVA